MFSSGTNKIARLDGQIFAAEYSITTLESLLGGDHDTAINSKISFIQGHIASLNQSMSYYASKAAGSGSMDAESILDRHVRGFSEQAIIFNGWPVMCREKDKLESSTRMNAMMSHPDGSFNMQTMIGLQPITVADCQGLMYAGTVLANVIRDAVDDTLNQHAAEPFGTWAAMRNHFNQYFGNNYVPFVSS